jgi:hypothetical protein
MGQHAPETLLDLMARIAPHMRRGLLLASRAPASPIPRGGSASRPTRVKTHLGRVFAKTGAGRQAELARLVAVLAQVRD